MNIATKLTEQIISDITRIGHGIFLSWMDENDFKINTDESIFNGLEAALKDEIITISDINSAINEIEENSDKKAYLFQALDYEVEDLNVIRKHLKNKYGFNAIEGNLPRVVPGDGPTFAYLYIDENVFKIKYTEKHYDVDIDIENESFSRIPRIVNVIFIVEKADGFSQLRFDKAGQISTHKNEQGKPSQLAFEQYYRDLIFEFFNEITFQEVNLTGVANHIAFNEMERFFMKKEVTTVDGGAKQTYATAKTRKKDDVRLLSAHIGAAASVGAEDWTTEDITGYWLAEYSQGELKKDLFMRIYRRDSEIRVQRGCLAKEFNYGIKQIREIQNGI